MRYSIKSHASKQPSSTQEELLSLDASQASRGPSFQNRPPAAARLPPKHQLFKAAKSQDELQPCLEVPRSPADPASTLHTSHSKQFLKKAIVVERKLNIDLGDNPLAQDQSFNTPTASTGLKRRSQMAAETKKAPLLPLPADSALFKPHSLGKVPSAASNFEDAGHRKNHQKLKIITGSSHGRRDAKAGNSLYKITSNSFNKSSKTSLRSASKDKQSGPLRVDRSTTSVGGKGEADRQQITPFGRKLAELELENTPKKAKAVKSTDPFLFDSGSKYQSRFLSSIKRVQMSESQKDCGRPLFGPLGPASATYYKDRMNEHHTREIERKIADRRIRILQSSLAQLERDSDRLAREEQLSAGSAGKKAPL